MRKLSVDDVVHLVVPTSVYSVQTSGRTLCDLFEWFTAEMLLEHVLADLEHDRAALLKEGGDE